MAVVDDFFPNPGPARFPVSEQRTAPVTLETAAPDKPQHHTQIQASHSFLFGNQFVLTTSLGNFQAFVSHGPCVQGGFAYDFHFNPFFLQTALLSRPFAMAHEKIPLTFHFSGQARLTGEVGPMVGAVFQGNVLPSDRRVLKDPAFNQNVYLTEDYLFLAGALYGAYNQAFPFFPKLRFNAQGGIKWMQSSLRKRHPWERALVLLPWRPQGQVGLTLGSFEGQNLIGQTVLGQKVVLEFESVVRWGGLSPSQAVPWGAQVWTQGAQRVPWDADAGGPPKRVDFSPRPEYGFYVRVGF